MSLSCSAKPFSSALICALPPEAVHPSTLFIGKCWRLHLNHLWVMVNLMSIFFCATLGFELRASCLRCRHSTTLLSDL
jgi:hypothetical protein